MRETEHYKLTKDAPEDFYDVAKVGANMDKIDTALNGLEGGKAPKSHTHTAGDVGALPTSGGTMTGDILLEEITSVKFVGSGELMNDGNGVIGVYPGVSGARIKLSGMGLTGVQTPTSPTDAANKKYVDDAEQRTKDASEKAGAVAGHNTNATAHIDIRNALSAAQQLAQEAKSLADGRSRAVSYAGYSSMVEAVNIMAKTAMRVGDNLLLEALGVPDLWVSKVEATAVIYTYTTDEALEAALENGPVQMGYYKLTMLETPKVDLSGYVPTTRTINGKPLTANITLTAGDVGARPSTWVPSWTDVTGKPGAFTPSAHTHTVSEVMGALKQFGPVNITIPAGSWSGSGPWTQNVAVSGVLAAWDWKLKLSLQKQTVTDTRKAQEKAMGCVTYCETYNGGVTLTCFEKKPEASILAVLSGEV